MTVSVDLERARLEFAERLREVAGLRSPALVRALATVPREHFVGPGPWQILSLSDLAAGYRLTPDDDPRHLYDMVLVALDANRLLNNGEPASLLRWLDSLDLGGGDRFLHIGCGVGYYTAIAAEAVHPGSVVGVEVDPHLAERAKRNLAAYENVEVIWADGSEYEGDPFDAIFVNAGATEVRARWLDQLRIGGRLLVPLTVALPPALRPRWFGKGMDAGTGQMLLIVRHASGYAACFVSPVLGIFHCVGARTDGGDDLLAQAFQRGGHEAVRSLRRDKHSQGPECWFHTSDFCLSSVA